MSQPPNALPLRLPHQTHTQEGKERRVGVEIELSGLSYQELIQVVSLFFGAPAREKARYEQIIPTELGDFCIELDADPIKHLELQGGDLPQPLAFLSEKTGELIDAAAEQIVPLEVICPPIALSQLPIIEALCIQLRESGALGSRHSFWYAFGLQLNPELPALDAATILYYLRAFGGLYAWFKSRRQLDISRKFTTYIDPYPGEYLDLIMAPDYRPDLEQLMADYLRYNPTRNRALDLMPLFLHLRPEQLRASISDPRIKARPTLHVRLPDCDIDNPHWHFAQLWNDWVQIEDLATDRDRLAQMCAAYQERHRFRVENLFHDWLEDSQAYLPHPSETEALVP